jgi:hypothetical protein
MSPAAALRKWRIRWLDKEQHLQRRVPSEPFAAPHVIE